MQTWDVVIVGAGAAGLMCAGAAGQRGLSVLLLDHAPRLAEKIRISGGGRCNFTNLGTSPAQFISENPAFCRSALAGYSPQDFLDLLKHHGVPWHEKHRGQLFCDHRSQDIIDVLVRECERGQVQRWQGCAVQETQALGLARASDGARFELQTDRGRLKARQLVIATGGPSIPKIGASDWGQRLASRLEHAVVPMRPALVPLVFDSQAWQPLSGLAGIALGVRMSLAPLASGAHPGNKARGRKPAISFDEDLLFTHRGLSGPAVLQISSYWQAGQALQIDLVPGREVGAALVQAKQGSRKQLSTAWSLALGESIAQRMAHTWLELACAQRPGLSPQRALAEIKDQDLLDMAQSLQPWTPMPVGSEGYAKAEVTVGGVDTRELDSKSMESRRISGLYFIGEVVDVTGWLGGYNFQWAWASAMACARHLRAALA